MTKTSPSCLAIEEGNPAKVPPKGKKSAYEPPGWVFLKGGKATDYGSFHSPFKKKRRTPERVTQRLPGDGEKKTPRPEEKSESTLAGSQPTKRESAGFLDEQRGRGPSKGLKPEHKKGQL